MVQQVNSNPSLVFFSLLQGSRLVHSAITDIQRIVQFIDTFEKKRSNFLGIRRTYRGQKYSINKAFLLLLLSCDPKWEAFVIDLECPRAHCMELAVNVDNLN